MIGRHARARGPAAAHAVRARGTRGGGARSDARACECGGAEQRNFQLLQSDRHRLQVQLRAAQRGDLVSLRRGSGDRAAGRRVFSLRDGGRRLLALARSHALAVRDADALAVRGHCRAGGALRARHDVLSCSRRSSRDRFSTRRRPRAGSSSSTTASCRRCRVRCTTVRFRPGRRTRFLPDRGIPISFTIPTATAGISTGARRTSIRCTGSRWTSSKQLTYMGEPRVLLSLHPELHGWERFGRNHGDTIHPYVEGAWMTKHGGRYYSAVRRARHRIQRVRERHLRRRQRARTVHVCAVQSGVVQAGRVRDRRGARQHLRGCARQLLEHGDDVDRLELELRATHRDVSRGFRRRRRHVRRHAVRRLPASLPAAHWQRSSDLFLGWMLLSYRKPARATSERHEFTCGQRDRRESAHVLGRARHIGAANRSRSTSVRRARCARAGELRRLQVGEVRERLLRLHEISHLPHRSTAGVGASSPISRARRVIGRTRTSSSQPGARALRALRAPARGRERRSPSATSACSATAEDQRRGPRRASPWCATATRETRTSRGTP